MAEPDTPPRSLRTGARSRASLRCRLPSPSRGSGFARVRVHQRGQEILIERAPVHADATGLSLSSAIWTMVRKFSSRRLLPTLPGLMRYLASVCAVCGIFREQQVAVVVEVADQIGT